MRGRSRRGSCRVLAERARWPSAHGRRVAGGAELGPRMLHGMSCAGRMQGGGRQTVCLLSLTCLLQVVR